MGAQAEQSRPRMKELATSARGHVVRANYWQTDGRDWPGEEESWAFLPAICLPIGSLQMLLQESEYSLPRVARCRAIRFKEIELVASVRVKNNFAQFRMALAQGLCVTYKFWIVI